MNKTQKLQKEAIDIELLKSYAVDRLIKDALNLAEIQAKLSFVTKEMLRSLSKKGGSK